jgi:putative endonuclease
MDNDKAQLSAQWWVYIIRASDDSLYTGITTDLIRRFEQHKAKSGAKYFYGRDPVMIVFREGNHTRRSASQREAYIKSLSRQQKEDLIKNFELTGFPS